MKILSFPGLFEFLKKTRLGLMVLIVAVIVITSVSYYPSLKNKFVNWDDPVYVLENKSIMNLSFHNIKRMFSSYYAGSYTPLTILSFAVDYKLYGYKPSGYHLTNLCFHIFNALLVFWLMYLLSGNLIGGFVISILFSIHPMHVESVAWISSRKDVLFAFFFFLSCISYIYYLKSKYANYRYFILSFVAFLFSVLSKPMAVSIPVLFLLFDYLFSRILNVKMLVEKAPFALVSAAISVVALISQKIPPGADPELMLSNIQNVSNGVMFYLSRLLVPLNLSAVYPSSDVITGFIPKVVVILMFVAVIFGHYYTRKVSFGILFFIVTVLPVIQFVPIGNGFHADRYTYVPYIAVFYMMSVFLSWVFRQKTVTARVFKPVIAVFFLVSVGLLSFETYKRNYVWNDGLSLWKDAISKHRSSAMIYYNMGDAYLNEGKYKKAAGYFDVALKLKPRYFEAYNGRGVAYTKLGQYEKAIDDFKKSIEIRRNYAKPYNNLGLEYYRMGEYKKAIENFNYAVKHGRDFAEAYTNRGNAYVRLGQYDKAIDDYTEALKIDPCFAEACHGRAGVYIFRNDYAKARKDLLTLKNIGYPVNEDLLKILNNPK